MNAILNDIAANPNAPTNAEHVQAHTKAKDEFLAVLFLVNSDQKQYSGLLCDLENGYIWGSDTYPMTLSVAYDYIINYKPDKGGTIDADEGGLAFYNDDNDESGHGECSGRGCGAGHGSQGGQGSGSHGRGGRCGNAGRGSGGQEQAEIPPNNRMHGQAGEVDNEDEVQFLLDNLDKVEEYSFTTCHDFLAYAASSLSPNLLLDSCSTLDLITDGSLLHGIHKVQ